MKTLYCEKCGTPMDRTPEVLDRGIYSITTGERVVSTRFRYRCPRWRGLGRLCNGHTNVVDLELIPHRG